MYSKEAIKLAKPCYEAIKTLAERREKKCPECNGLGIIYSFGKEVSACSVCKETGKLKWEWKPKVGDSVVIDGRLSILVELHYMEDYPYRTSTEAIFNKWDVKEHKAIPFLHWERILKILRDFGYTVGITLGQTSGTLVIYHEKINKKALHKSMNLNKVQPVVMRAVIELAREE